MEQEPTGGAPQPLAPSADSTEAETGFEGPPPAPTLLPPTPPAAEGAGWAVREPDPAAAAPDRPRDFIIPLIVLLVTAGGLTWLRVSNASTGYAQGVAIGTTLGVLILAGLFYVVARRFGGPRGRRRARLIAACLPLLLLIFGSFGQLAASRATAADPQTAMVMGAPFQLAAAPATVVQQVTGEGAAGLWAVKQVNRGTAVVGYLMATGMASSESDGQFWAEFDKGVTDSGASSASTLIGDVPGRIVTGKGTVGLAWRVSGVSVQVLAADEASARAIAAAQMAAQASPSP